MTLPTGECAEIHRRHLTDIVNTYLTEDDSSIEEMADLIYTEVQLNFERCKADALNSLITSGIPSETKIPSKIKLSYRHVDTKQYHEFNFSDWRAAIEFAKMVDRSDETELLDLKVDDQQTNA